MCTKSIGSALKLFSVPLFKRLQPKESYSGLCSSSNLMTFKSTAHLYFNLPSVGHIFCLTSKETGFSLRGEETLLLLYRKGMQIFLPAIGKERVFIPSNSVGNLALTESQSFLQVLSCQQKGIQISGVLVMVCFSSISFLFKRIFFCCSIFSFPCVVPKQVVIEAVR